jgi:hypothetical protein
MTQRLGCAALLLLASACSAPLASPPKLPAKDAPELERRHAYEDYRLFEEGNVWTGWSWKRVDGKYSFGGIEPLLTSPQASPEMKKRVHDIHVRSALAEPLTIVGAAFLGLALGDALSSPNHIFTSTTRTGLWLTGGTLTASGLVITIAWDPVTGLGGLYNHDLAESLALPPTPDPGAR